MRRAVLLKTAPSRQRRHERCPGGRQRGDVVIRVKRIHASAVIVKVLIIIHERGFTDGILAGARIVHRPAIVMGIPLIA